MSVYTERRDAFAPAYLKSLRSRILGSPYLSADPLNRDFVGARGFAVVFRRESRERVVREFPYFEGYLASALRDDCNAFYLNPLCLQRGSRVDPHVDRSLRAYCPTVATPLTVSVLYVEVPPEMRGGELVLQRGRRHLARVKPIANTLLCFGGDLTHSVERVEADGARLSVVCEQYQLTPGELESIPSFLVETRTRSYD
jgi:hypothetical protein